MLVCINLTVVNLLNKEVYIYPMSGIAQIATKIAGKFEVLSNPYRTLILAFLLKKKEASWSDIKQFLESNAGSINPNTLQFHLKALLHANMVRRSGSEDNIVYTPGIISDEISGMLDEVVQKLNSKE